MRLLALALFLVATPLAVEEPLLGSNPIIRDRFTAGPAPMVIGSGEGSFTIHPGIAEFQGQWYLFLRNAALTIGEQRGALGRRAVTVEQLTYGDQGLMHAIAQTRVGVTAPVP